ncbi:MAG: hypothetical protein VR64_13250 [Desulfatitalea sp. BRH_c12]|nr:MAG: hypothetical protein VR64_13250 [Desulfatitalea sp. BRH_c12]
MRITVNGQPETTTARTIDQLIFGKGLIPERLVVEHNRVVVPQAQWPDSQLQEDDVLELLSFVGGG